ncbi:hypothetical protein BH708_04925 [Brachybacterium sp. P6-10-X1]|uniref:hypothetical protein n=1 Tax=Brachybacterium sp. P6-10-X1 TaxID=1903186 RepID=UPI000971A67C|nr:hypothetical protein [Brachybacterium sp. P6-10-X1]APX32175.1 hypothetical protein BH708_04925 [Brachybacterium sp. P6-10-X1]
MTTKPLPLLALLALALLGVPRVVLHDLDLIHEGTGLNAVFVAVPLLVWIGVVVWRRPPRPFLTLLAVGVIHGILLAVTHQLLWTVSFGDSPPRLGGNLADLSPVVQAVITRSFAVISSLVTGTVLGALTGLVAWALSPRRRAPRPAR